MNNRSFGASLKFAMAILFLPTLLWSIQSGEPVKTFAGEITDSICAPAGSHTVTIARTPGMGNDSESCTRKCATMGAKYVLLDQATHNVYLLDSQDKLAEFAGHKVRVVGTVNGNAIKISNIAELG